MQIKRKIYSWVSVRQIFIYYNIDINIDIIIMSYYNNTNIFSSSGAEGQKLTHWNILFIAGI